MIHTKFRRIKFPAEISPLSDDSTCLFYRGGRVRYYIIVYQKNFFYSTAILRQQSLFRRTLQKSGFHQAKTHHDLEKHRRIQSPFIRLKPAVMDAVILSIGISGPRKEKKQTVSVRNKKQNPPPPWKDKAFEKSFPFPRIPPPSPSEDP